MTWGRYQIAALPVWDYRHEVRAKWFQAQIVEGSPGPGPAENHAGLSASGRPKTQCLRLVPDNKVTQAQWKFGTMTCDVVVHDVRNSGKTNSHAIRIELK
jgi:hypothetical protein